MIHQMREDMEIAAQASPIRPAEQSQSVFKNYPGQEYRQIMNLQDLVFQKQRVIDNMIESQVKKQSRMEESSRQNDSFSSESSEDINDLSIRQKLNLVMSENARLVQERSNLLDMSNRLRAHIKSQKENQPPLTSVQKTQATQFNPENFVIHEAHSKSRIKQSQRATVSQEKIKSKISILRPANNNNAKKDEKSATAHPQVRGALRTRGVRNWNEQDDQI